MAVDIIIRPEGRCITLAFDVDMKPISALLIGGPTVRARFEDGEYMDFGPLTEAMRLDAEKCSICVVAKLDGDKIEYSHKVDLVSD